MALRLKALGGILVEEEASASITMKMSSHINVNHGLGEIIVFTGKGMKKCDRTS